MSVFQSVSPVNGTVLRRYTEHGPEEVDRRLTSAGDAFRTWRDAPFAVRADCLRRIAGVLREKAGDWARLMALEMGKPLAEGEAEAGKCAWVCEFYAEKAEGFLAAEDIASDGSISHVRCDPLGLILAVMPWNFPFWQVFRFGAPALMAGNAFLLKHAPNTPDCADAIEGILAAALPNGLAANLRVGVDRVTDLVADPRIAAVTLTGSTRAGESIAALAGRHLKKSVLELGGSDPFVVLVDADLERAAETAAASRLLNSGQSCIAAKRIIVVEDVAARFMAAFEARLLAAVVGDPADPTTTVGPLARADLREALHRQVTTSVGQGAVLRFGGQIPGGSGWFYPVSLLTEVGPGMPVWDEEVFGPVAAVRIVPGEEAAIAAANDTAYGLGASLCSGDTARAAELASRIEAGALFVNGPVKSDPRLPFGGIKRSGYGRELSWHGIREFVNQKTVWAR